MYKPVYKQKIISINNMPPDEHQRQFIKKTRCLRCGQRFNEKHRRIVFVEMDTGQVLWWHGLINSANYGCKEL